VNLTSIIPLKYSDSENDEIYILKISILKKRRNKDVLISDPYHTKVFRSIVISKLKIDFSVELNQFIK